jgi:predicted nucleic acid-binding protein
MVMLDTNMILRYLLNDNKEMADKTEDIEVATFDVKLLKLIKSE